MPDRKAVRTPKGSSKFSMDGHFAPPQSGRKIGLDSAGLEHIGTTDISIAAAMRHYLNFRR